MTKITTNKELTRLLKESLLARTCMRLGTLSTDLSAAVATEFACDIVDSFYSLRPTFGWTGEGMADQKLSDMANRFATTISGVRSEEDVWNFNIEEYVELQYM